jgi:hypothetical protein
MHQSFLYIDPGSSSMLVQALIGLGLGAMVFFRNIRHGISSLFRKKQKEEEE